MSICACTGPLAGDHLCPCRRRFEDARQAQQRFDIAQRSAPTPNLADALAEVVAALDNDSPKVAACVAADFLRTHASAIAALQGRAQRAESLLREAQPFIGWTGSYHDLHAKIDAALSADAVEKKDA